jgi:hypothetical protein
MPTPTRHASNTQTAPIASEPITISRDTPQAAVIGDHKATQTVMVPTRLRVSAGRAIGKTSTV